MARVEQHGIDSATSETTVLVRLCGIGLFNDPNDLSLVLVISIIVCGFFLTDPGINRRARQFLLFPLALFFYALYLTHSRGGIVSASAGLFTFLCARVRGRNVLAAVLVLLPLLIVGSWLRSTIADLENPDDTFQTRLELWNGSFDALRSAPLLGIGQDRLIDEIGQVAHNSYLHAYAEMGLLGGTAFLGTFYLVLRGLCIAAPEDPELARMRPYVLALMAAYAAGLLSLSRCYHAPTQLVIAVATAYLVLASRSGPVVIPPMNGACIRRITGVGLLFLAATYVFLRLMLQRGVS
jgi:O-antigen ligase